MLKSNIEKYGDLSFTPKPKPGDEIRTKPGRARKMQKKAQGHVVAESMELRPDETHPFYELTEERGHTG